MRYVDKYLGDTTYSFLEVTIYDSQDIQSLSNYKNEKNILISAEYLNYLPYFTKTERLIITSGEMPDNSYDILKTQQELRALKIDYDETDPSTLWCINISAFPKLEYLFSRSSYNFCGIASSKSLRTLIVQKWYDENLLSLKNSFVDSLCIYGGKLKTLEGIDDSPINILSLSNLRNLKSISQIEKLPLKMLELDHCNQINSLEELSSNTLEYLMIYGKNRVRSANFILNFKNLKRVMFDILIEDGDLSDLDNLEHAVILTDKRHFNRTNSQLPKATQKYIIENIPQWRYIYSDRML